MSSAKGSKQERWNRIQHIQQAGGAITRHKAEPLVAMSIAQGDAVPDKGGRVMAQTKISVVAQTNKYYCN